MIVVRTVIQAKFGKAAELARLSAEMNREVGEWPGAWRVLTDLSGPFDTVVLEIEVESLAAWEQARSQLFSQPAFQAAFSRIQELAEGGSTEYFTLEATS